MLILGFSGKKQSGKNSACRFLTENAHIIFPYNGKIPNIKTFSMAGPLKRLAVDVLGLEPKQVYGTDEEKNSLTKYSWEMMPHYRQACDSMKQPYGPLTARQVLQEVGTGIFRKMNPNIWAEACLRKIKNWDGDVALIDDVRFPNECRAIHEAGGLVFRLTRNVANGDRHPSECELDHYDKFDAIVENQDTLVETQNAIILTFLSFKIPGFRLKSENGLINWNPDEWKGNQ